MATPLGTYTGTVTNIFGNPVGYTFSVLVQYDQNITNNTTTLYITPTCSINSGSVGYAITVDFKVDGNTYYTAYHNFATHGTNLVGQQYTKTIGHNADGTKTITLDVSAVSTYTQGANANLNNGTPKYFTLNKSITLPTIPRASDFSWSGTLTMGTAKSFTISRASSSFTHKVYYFFGNTSGTISKNATTSFSWTPSRDLGNQIPNSLNGTGSIRVDTYNGSTLIGRKSKNFTLYVTGDMMPSFNLVITGSNLNNGRYIRTMSSYNASINSAVGSYGSTIKSCSISGEGLSTNSTSGTSSILYNAGTFRITAKVTDSRGRTATRNWDITVVDYRQPGLYLSGLARINSSGVLQDDGTYVQATISYSFSDLDGQGTLGNKTYSLQYREKGANSAFIELASGSVPALSNDYFVIKNTSTVLDIAKSYEVLVILNDTVNSVSASGMLSAASCVLNIEQNGVGIGKYYEKGALDVGGDLYVNGRLIMDDYTKTLTAGMAIAMKNGSNGSYDTLIECTDGRPFSVWTATASNQVAMYIRDDGRLVHESQIIAPSLHLSDYSTPMEIGRYIDLHNPGTDTDADTRLDTGGYRDRLRITSGADMSKYVDICVDSSGSYIYPSKAGKSFNIKTDRLQFDGCTVPHNWKQNFTPFIFADNGNFSMSEGWGTATYLGDLVYVTGRVTGSRGGLSGTVYIGGLPVSNQGAYPSLNLSFFGGITTSLGTTCSDIKAYIDGANAHAVLNFTNKDSNGWHPVQCSHLTTGIVDIAFSAVYRWR